jgi:hypothetical protein
VPSKLNKEVMVALKKSMLAYTRSLGFAEQPDYDKIIGMIETSFVPPQPQ